VQLRFPDELQAIAADTWTVQLRFPDELQAIAGAFPMC